MSSSNARKWCWYWLLSCKKASFWKRMLEPYPNLYWYSSRMFCEGFPFVKTLNYSWVFFHFGTLLYSASFFRRKLWESLEWASGREPWIHWCCIPGMELWHLCHAHTTRDLQVLLEFLFFIRWSLLLVFSIHGLRLEDWNSWYMYSCRREGGHISHTVTAFVLGRAQPSVHSWITWACRPVSFR